MLQEAASSNSPSTTMLLQEQTIPHHVTDYANGTYLVSVELHDNDYAVVCVCMCCYEPCGSPEQWVLWFVRQSDPVHFHTLGVSFIGILFLSISLRSRIDNELPSCGLQRTGCATKSRTVCIVAKLSHFFTGMHVTGRSLANHKPLSMSAMLACCFSIVWLVVMLLEVDV